MGHQKQQQQPIGSIVVPFWGSYLESYKVIPKRNYYGASGYSSPPNLIQNLEVGDTSVWA